MTKNGYVRGCIGINLNSLKSATPLTPFPNQKCLDETRPDARCLSRETARSRRRVARQHCSLKDRYYAFAEAFASGQLEDCKGAVIGVDHSCRERRPLEDCDMTSREDLGHITTASRRSALVLIPLLTREGVSLVSAPTLPLGDRP